MSDFIVREELILNAKRANAACILLKRPECLIDGDTCYFFAAGKEGVLTIREGVKTVYLIEPWVKEIDRFIIPCTLESIEDTDAWEEFSDACLLNSSSKFDLEVEMHSRSESVINKFLEAGVFFDFSSSVCIDIFRAAGKSLNDELNIDMYYSSYLLELINGYVNNSAFTNSSGINGLDEYTEALNVFIQEACKAVFNVLGIQKDEKTYMIEDFGLDISKECDKALADDRVDGNDVAAYMEEDYADHSDSIDNLDLVVFLKDCCMDYSVIGGRLTSVFEVVSRAGDAINSDGVPFYDETVAWMKAFKEFYDEFFNIYVGSLYLHMVNMYGIMQDKLEELNRCFQTEFTFGLGMYIQDSDED